MIPLWWNKGGEKRILEPEMLCETIKNIGLVHKRLLATQSRQKSYVDQGRRKHTFEIGDHMFLKVTPQQGIMRFRLKGKLSPRYMGPFYILEKIRGATYRLAIPPQLDYAHNVFHVLILKKYILTQSTPSSLKHWVSVTSLMQMLRKIHFRIYRFLTII